MNDDGAGAVGGPPDPTTADQDKSNPSRDTAMGLSVVGGGLGAIEQIEAGRTNQEIARYNANIARTQAAQAIQAGGFAAVRRQVLQDQLSGRTIAQQAGSGTVVGAGTNRLARNDQELGSAMDEYMLKLNATRQASADNVRGAGDELQGDLARRAGETGAISTLLNTGGNLALESDPNFDPRYSRGLAVGTAGGY